MIKQLAAIAIAASTCLAVTSAQAADLKACVAGLTEEACPAKETVNVEIGLVGNVLKLNGGRAFSSIHIGDPNIVDVKLLSGGKFILHGIHPGRTNVLFLDEDSDTLKNLDIVVLDTKAAPRGQVLVFNRPSLLGFTTYRCNDRGCGYLTTSEYQRATSVVRYEGVPQIQIRNEEAPPAGPRGGGQPQ